MLQTIERVYSRYDNTIDLVLLADGDIPDLTSVTRMQLELADDLVIDSQVASAAFNWSSTLTQDEASRIQGAEAGDAKLILALGAQSIPVGKYNAKLIVFDASNQNGLVWGRLRIVVE